MLTLHPFFLWLSVLIVMTTWIANANANTIIVSNLADEGEGSLRNAILIANQYPEPDNIEIKVTGTIQLNAMLPPIISDLKITGTGTNQLKIMGNGYGLVMQITTGNVTIENLTISGGFMSFGNGSPGKGAGIYVVDGNVTLKNVALTEHRVQGDAKGQEIAVYANNGKINLINCTFADNLATGQSDGRKIRVIDPNSRINASAAKTTATTIIYVNANLTTGADNGTSWANAFRTGLQLQRALTAAGTPTAANDVEIWVAAGTYKPAVAGGSRSAAFQLKNHCRIYGGFNGTETARNLRNWKANPTILSGDLNGNDIWFNNNTENSYNVCLGNGCNNTARLDGFTISHGFANGSFPQNMGGGIMNQNGTPTIANCRFYNCNGDWGGGIRNQDTGPTVQIYNCTISDCWAAFNGGGSNSMTTTVNFVNITYNSNYSGSNGGGTVNWGATVNYYNCTFTGNLCSGSGGAIYTTGGTNNMRNFIVWNNYAPTGIEISGTGTFTTGIIKGGVCPGTCTGLLNVDPKFVNAPNNVKLLSCSPAINAGSNALMATDIADIDEDANVVELVPRDGDNLTRQFGANVDLGAHEHQGTDILLDTIPGRMLTFDGLSNYAETGFYQHMTTFTVECWVYSPAAPTNGPTNGPIQKGNNFKITWNDPVVANRGSGQVNIGGTTRTVSFGTLAAGTWNHLALTYDNTALRAYTNGNLISTLAVTGVPVIDTRTMKFGSNETATNFWNGSIEEVRIWDVARTMQQIRENMHLTTHNMCSVTGLVSYWQFNAPVGNLILNENGILRNGTTQAPSPCAVGKGTSVTQVITTNGLVSFPGTRVNINFSGVSGTSEVVVSHINQTYNVNTTSPSTTFPAFSNLNTNHYWVINKFNTGTIGSYAPTFHSLPDVLASDISPIMRLRAAKRGSRDVGAWTNLYTPTSGTPSTGSAWDGIHSYNGLVGFSQFVLGSEPVPLPIELIEFSGFAQVNDAIISWKLGRAFYAKYELLMQRVGSDNFTVVSKQAGDKLAYQAHITNLLAGTYHFRLQQKAADGIEHLSDIIEITIGHNQNPTLHIYPNPISKANELTLVAPNSGTARIVNITGQIVFKTELIQGINTIHLPNHLAPGQYFIEYAATRERVKLIIKD